MIVTGISKAVSHPGTRSLLLLSHGGVGFFGLVSGTAQASLFAGETLDAVANGVAWVVIFVVPLVVIALFWMVHVLPEKIAHKRHHPQTKAIQTLCLLSLVFGGLLWPIAWLWAYTRPVGHKMAYGTDKDEAYFLELEPKVRRGELTEHELAELRNELDTMQARGALSAPLAQLREDLDVIPPRRAEAELPAAPSPVQLERRSA